MKAALYSDHRAYGPRRTDVLWIHEFEEIMKDAGFFFFEDNDGVLFVCTTTSLHGGKGVLGSCAVHLVFALELMLGVSRALKLG